ncbi:MAG: hypothetical protein AAFX50_03830, partial [Acidobacteriota bacterium]
MPDAPRLDAVFVQYDRAKYPGAFERFLAVVDGLGADYRIAVVDNAKTGDWFHTVSSRVAHVSGDNSAWEFSAFDRGVDFLDGTRGDRRGGADWPGDADLWLIATDAFLAYGDDYLDWIRPAAVRFCLEASAPVGWVDSFSQPLGALGLGYRDWLRTSFMLIPDAVLRELGPLRTRVDADAIFGETAEAPFRDDAPVSEALRRCLLAWLTSDPGDAELDETWHSRFVLDGDTLPFFKRKASAILREHLLSARLQAAGVDAFDLRLVDALDRAGRHAGSLDAAARRRAAWNGWRSVPAAAEPAWHLDTVELPERFTHGELERLEVAGWAAPGAGSRPGEVEVELLPDTGAEPLVLRERCDRFRPDVLEALPRLGDGRCGFLVERNLAILEPALYRVTLRLRGTSMRHTLGHFQVVPRLDCEPTLRWPRTVARGEACALGFDAELTSSAPPDVVEVYWNGAHLPDAFEPHGAHVLDRDGFGLHRCRLRGLIHVTPPDDAPVQSLELRFLTARGRRLGTWSHAAPMRLADRRSHAFSLRRVSPVDPDTGLADVELAGVVWLDGDGDGLELVADGETLADVPHAPAAGPGQPAAFALHQRVPMAPGDIELRVDAVDVGGGRRPVASWLEVVRRATPALEVDHVRVRPPEGRRREHLIFLSGWIEHHTAIDGLQLLLDDRARPEPLVVGAVPIERSRKDVAAFRGDPLMRRQAFHVEIPAHVDAGAHELQLEASWHGARKVLWRQSAAFDAPVAEKFQVESEALEALEQRRLGPLRAALVVEGRVR